MIVAITPHGQEILKEDVLLVVAVSDPTLRTDVTTRPPCTPAITSPSTWSSARRSPRTAPTPRSRWLISSDPKLETDPIRRTCSPLAP